MKKDSKEIIDVICQTIYDKKGSNIIALDVKGISSITDYIIVAEGNVDRHLNAIANSIIDELRDIGEKPLHIEGKNESDWIVIDFINIIVHLFLPKEREKYKIEQMFQDANIIETNIKISG
jgi:ribosome-associated protein